MAQLILLGLRFEVAFFFLSLLAIGKQLFHEHYLTYW